MGQILSVNFPKAVVGVISGSRKRKRHPSDYSESEDDHFPFLQRTMHTPKRKKLKSTSEYIHQALFKEGLGSDVTVVILNKEWKLHRIYLSQSPYFKIMFSGLWKEANEDTIEIEVVDPNITVDGLDLVLGSLYMNELILEPENVIPVLAAASLFQLEGVINNCVEIMKETVNFQTVVAYYYNADVYCLEDVKDASYNWLLTNLLHFMDKKPEKLKEIEAPLMISLITNPDLYVIQMEFYVYTLLRYWMFLKLDTGKNDVEESKEYFSNLPGGVEFLLTEKGLRFVPVFKHLRFYNLMGHHMDVEKLKDDRVIPWKWLAPYCAQQWYQMMRLDHGPDSGPRGLSDDEFLNKCIRCGRVLKLQGDNVWRWTGYNFGLDLIWTISGNLLKVRRLQHVDNSIDVMMSQRIRRHLMIRVTLITFDKQRQVKHSQTTGVREITLLKNQEVILLDLEPEVQFPLHISLNILAASPCEVEDLDMASEQTDIDDNDDDDDVEDVGDF